MKQNHKKIKIYSEALCNSVDTFETFQNIKVCLHELTALSKKDLMINTFLKSKSVDLNKKMNIFTEAFKEVFDKMQEVDHNNFLQRRFLRKTIQNILGYKIKRVKDLLHFQMII